MAKKDDFFYKVKRRLDEKFMEQQELAPMLGISQSRVSAILLGRSGSESRMNYIPQIAKILNIPDAELPEDVQYLMKKAQ